MLNDMALRFFVTLRQPAPEARLQTTCKQGRRKNASRPVCGLRPDHTTLAPALYSFGVQPTTFLNIRLR